MNIYALYLKYSCLYVSTAENKRKFLSMCPDSIKRYARIEQLVDKTEKQWIKILKPLFQTNKTI